MPDATPATATLLARRETLRRLKDRLARIEPGGLWRRRETEQGLSALLVPAALNEVRASEPRDRPAALGFSLALAAAQARKSGGAVAFLTLEHWALREGVPHPTGLSVYGIHAEDFFAVFASDAKSLLWAAEETARSCAVAATIVDIPGAQRLLDLSSTRRLHLAAQSSGVACILLRTISAAEPTAAARRWRVRAAPSLPDMDDDKAPGAPRWRVDLERCRAGGRGSFIAEFNADGADPLLLDLTALSRAPRPVFFDRPVEARRAV